MKYESKPEEVEAMQWSGNPDELLTLLDWIMSDRVTENEPPRVTFTIDWAPYRDMVPFIEAQLRGDRWTADVEPNGWVVKKGRRVWGMQDADFRKIYKQKRSKR